MQVHTMESIWMDNITTSNSNQDIFSFTSAASVIIKNSNFFLPQTGTVFTIFACSSAELENINIQGASNSEKSVIDIISSTCSIDGLTITDSTLFPLSLVHLKLSTCVINNYNSHNNTVRLGGLLITEESTLQITNSQSM